MKITIMTSMMKLRRILVIVHQKASPVTKMTENITKGDKTLRTRRISSKEGIN